MNENPWRDLPAKWPFVLPDDADRVREFNEKPKRKDKHVLQLDILPEPFVGVIDAPVVLLSNNPGYGVSVPDRKRQDFMLRMRENLWHRRTKYPFLYLDPDLEGPHMKWWSRKLKHLLSRFGNEVVARSILNVVYFPYPSQRFGSGLPRLESQKYGFQLVCDAVNRGAVVVLMRRGKRKKWLGAVSELDGYDRFILLKNPRTPAVSPGNCCKGDFEKIVQAIEEAEAKRRES